jgi:hypothetical protein
MEHLFSFFKSHLICITFLDKTKIVISLRLDCTRKGPKVHVFMLQGNYVQNHSFKSQKKYPSLQ